ncbi:MAG: rhodanese-like domain-containing protein [Acidaminococcaceae bacterium]|nr:rhodanese-like domain-containing protein [Acidaminococcaceae bacterium]MDO4935098.1 rhodanese-like domain-containing protein [Phascolarctobacterium sp.]
MNNNGFEIISQETAKEIMSKPGDYVIVDVRNADEYADGHIANAVLVPLPDLEQAAKEKLPDKEQLLLVYCRSGHRSKLAAARLAELGYKNIKEFGGIIDWQWGIVK